MCKKQFGKAIFLHKQEQKVEYLHSYHTPADVFSINECLRLTVVKCCGLVWRGAWKLLLLTMTSHRLGVILPPVSPVSPKALAVPSHSPTLLKNNEQGSKMTQLVVMMSISELAHIFCYNFFCFSEIIKGSGSMCHFLRRE